ncbi:unnamed protein product [Ectocarpus sp. 13 AM-2016]
MTLLVVCLARRGVIEAGFFLSALLYPLAAAAGTFQPNVNASSSPRIYNASEINEDWLGYSCASVGDVNGDSLMDVIVGAYGSSHLSEGAAHVVYGTNTSAAYDASFLDLGAGGGGGLDGVDGFTLSGMSIKMELYAKLLSDTLDRQLSLQYTGNPLSSAGDVNGDGFGDILVGSPTAGAVSQGHTYLVFGGAGLPGRVNLTESDDVTGGNEGVVVFKGALTGEVYESGFSVSGGFDMNGDGLSDFMIGAPEGGTIGEFDGEAYVVFGQENLADSDTVMLDTDLDGTVGFSILGPSDDAYAGSSVAGIGVRLFCWYSR